MGEKNLAKALKESKQKKQGTMSSKKYLTWRVWVKYFRSLIDKSVYRIPKDIGNKMIIENNVLITKNGITMFFIITEYSADTPITLYEQLSVALGESDIEAKIDVIKRNRYYDPEMMTSGMKSRIRLWEKVITDEESSLHDKETSVQLLATVDVLKTGTRLLESSICLKVTGKDGIALQAASEVLQTKLKQYGISFIISNNIKEHAEYYNMSSLKPIGKKDPIQHIVVSPEVTSQLAPNLGSLNHKKGLSLGTNFINMLPYIINLESITKARNFLVLAGSGVGKTFIVSSIISSLAETKNSDGKYMRIRVDDIKGSELSAIVAGLGGLILRLSTDSSEYINPFKLIISNGNTALQTYITALEVGTEFILILSNLDEREKGKMAPLVTTFLRSFYAQKSVHESNERTFGNTLKITPFEVFKELERFVSPELDRRYDDIPTKMITNLRPYLGPGGAKNYLFRDEFDMDSIYERQAISCSYGLQDGGNATSYDKTVVDFKFFVGDLVKAKYQAYNTYVLKVQTGVVLEETQYASKRAREGYKKEITMGRSMKQTNFVLTNSFSAMMDDSNLAPIMENITCLLIGAQDSDKAKKDIVEFFGIQEYRKLLDMLNLDRYENCFLLVNRVGGTSTIVKAIANPNDKIYTGQR